MAKFASQTPAPIRVETAIKSKGLTVNHEGIDAFGRTSKTDLFLLGVTNFVGEDTFYESSEDRDQRYVSLVAKVTKKDPEWVANFVDYLRNTANMRSVAIVTAAEYVKAGGPNGRRVVSSALVRADEPAEMLAYWMNKYGRSVPAAIKRGVADAAQRLYNERNYIKYDSGNSKWRFADVIQISHVKPKDTKQAVLFKTILNERYNNKEEFSGEVLPMLHSYRSLLSQDREDARSALLSSPELMKNSGMTWESLSSFGPMNKEAWEAVIPQMGYMALLRNLRNFDENGVSDDVADFIINKLQDENEVARSRQLPFRFYAAYRNAPNLRWGRALERGLDHSLKNIPAFKGRTLVLVDTSGSMQGSNYSARSTMTFIESAALFGAALAKSGQDVDLVMFADVARKHEFPRGGSTLKTMKSLIDRVGEVGYGTNIPDAISKWDGHDRIVLLSDMQTTRYFTDSIVPSGVPVYSFNLAGYSSTIVNPDKLMYEFGGLTDNTFKMINAIESAQAAVWPWENR